MALRKKKQIERITMIYNMYKERLEGHIVGDVNYRIWRDSETTDWNNRPKTIPKSQVQRLSILLREELRKLDNLL